MTHLAIHFVDPTIPGLSGRDPIERSIESVQATTSEADNAYRATRQDVALRRGLSGLDRHQLPRPRHRPQRRMSPVAEPRAAKGRAEPRPAPLVHDSEMSPAPPGFAQRRARTRPKNFAATTTQRKPRAPARGSACDVSGEPGFQLSRPLENVCIGLEC